MSKSYHVNELIESHMYLVSIIMHRYFPTRNPHDREELTSIGYEALVVAAQKYNPEIAKFSTFAELKIRSGMMDYFRKRYRRERIAYFLSIDLELEDGMPFHETIEDNSARYEAVVESKVSVEEWLSCLSEDERQIISLYIGLDEEQGSRTLREIGAIVGVHRETVRRRKNQIVMKLREARRGVGA